MMERKYLQKRGNPAAETREYAVRGADMPPALQTLHSMTKKSKVSASQIYLCVALLTLLVALFIVAVVSEHAPVYAAFKEKGLAAEGTVTGKEIRIVHGTNRKGRRTETNSYFVKVSYDCMSRTPHAEAVAGKPMNPTGSPSVITGEILVATAEYEGLAVGAKTLVTFLPNKKFEPRLTASVQEYTPVWQLFTAGILFGTAVWTSVMAWKRRIPKAPASVLVT
jgi:hypothetical protein